MGSGRNQGHYIKPFTNVPCDSKCLKLHCLNERHFAMSKREKKRTEQLIDDGMKNIYKKHQGLSIEF